MKNTEDGGLLFQVTVNNEDEFIRWLLQYGEDAEILTPVTARNAMKEKLRRWGRVYGRSDEGKKESR
ncbi:WYL domain-containing protein [Paenibacillus cisolokensis]|uniref:WYL domain-containing protein n=1 Tax=Paenibacillus cisolokensis TaxID=1658519 RepID=UPI003D2E1212